MGTRVLHSEAVITHQKRITGLELEGAELIGYFSTYYIDLNTHINMYCMYTYITITECDRIWITAIHGLIIDNLISTYEMYTYIHM